TNINTILPSTTRLRVPRVRRVPCVRSPRPLVSALRSCLAALSIALSHTLSPSSPPTVHHPTSPPPQLPRRPPPSTPPPTPNPHPFPNFAPSASMLNSLLAGGPNGARGHLIHAAHLACLHVLLTCRCICLDSGRRTKVLVLLDFGLCIDMARFPPDTVFAVDKERSVKRSFPCIEMLTGRPWTFQRYMQVECVNGHWTPKFLPRTNRVYRAADVWREILSVLLNIQSCLPEDYPNLASLRASCEDFLRRNASNFNLAAEKANAIIHFLTSHSSATSSS
ncbi:unnamed protein product, partial [Hymenolepis diminuta]|uniref:Protein kinase domain-containing protein n=1 Tax=Hymenolepis diminuta TaxID=6216 RepID=A0A0R3SLP6_HYMDI